MFLIRTAFFVTLVILVMPVPEAHRADVERAARFAAREASASCELTPDLCAKSAEYWTTLRRKVEIGAGRSINLASRTSDEGPPSRR